MSDVRVHSKQVFSKIMSGKEKYADRGSRIVGFDNLRAFFIVSVVVIHAGAWYRYNKSYSVAEPGKENIYIDPVSASLLVDVTFPFFVLVSMPFLLFLVGYLMVAQLKRKGLKETLIARIRQLGLSFLIFGVPIIGVMALLGALTPHAYPTQEASLALALNTFFSGGWLTKQPLSELRVYHLWFISSALFFIIVSCVGIAAATRLDIPSNKQFGLSFEASAMPTFLLIGVFCVISLAIGYEADLYVRMPDTALVPEFSITLSYFMYFLFGVIAFYNPAIVENASKFDRYLLVLGALFSVLYIGFGYYLFLSGVSDPREANFSSQISLLVFQTLGSWLLFIGVIGFAVQNLNYSNPVTSYLQRTSFGIYIFHYPISYAWCLALLNVDADGEVKWFVNFVLTSVSTLAFYHVVIQPTFLENVLNGSKKRSDGNGVKGSQPLSP